MSSQKSPPELLPALLLNLEGRPGFYSGFFKQPLQGYIQQPLIPVTLPATGGKAAGPSLGEAARGTQRVRIQVSTEQMRLQFCMETWLKRLGFFIYNRGQNRVETHLDN